MLRAIIFGVLSLVLAGCAVGGSTTSLSLASSNSGTSFSAARCMAQTPFKFIGASNDFGRIWIERSFYQYGDEVLVLEHGQLDSNFVFSVSSDSLMIYALELKNAKLTSLGNFHTYIEGTNPQGIKVYMISAGFGAGENFDILYSDKEDTIKELASCVKNATAPNFKALTSQEKIQNLSAYIRSDFGPQLFFRHDVIMSRHDRELYIP